MHAVLTALSEADRPVTTNDIHASARRRGQRLALPTAYRLLKMLLVANVVDRYDLGDGSARYALRTRWGPGRLVNISNGTMAAFSDEELDAHLAKVTQKLGYEMIR